MTLPKRPEGMPETCRHCGKTRDEHGPFYLLGGSGPNCRIADPKHQWEPGPTYEQLAAERDALRELVRKAVRMIERHEMGPMNGGGNLPMDHPYFPWLTKARAFASPGAAGEGRK